jgi:hypothetical protein
MSRLMPSPRRLPAPATPFAASPRRARRSSRSGRGAWRLLGLSVVLALVLAACGDATAGKTCAADSDCPTEQPCQVGTCDTAARTCSYAVAPDACAIGGGCYQAGDPHPTERCAVCAPELDPTGWSDRPCGAGTACDPATGACAPGGSTPCDPNPCLHGGTCTEAGDRHACACSPGYSGPDCGARCDVCGVCDSDPSNDCDTPFVGVDLTACNAHTAGTGPDGTYVSVCVGPTPVAPQAAKNTPLRVELGVFPLAAPPVSQP